jgi:hypothetical protein
LRQESAEHVKSIAVVEFFAKLPDLTLGKDKVLFPVTKPVT